MVSKSLRSKLAPWFMAAAWVTTCAAGQGRDEMIEALKPQATGGTRNLVVRARPAASAASNPVAPVEAAPLAAAPVAAAPVATAPARLSLQVQFNTNSAQIRPESGPLLGNLAAAMLSPELQAKRFLIEGHTDAAGSAALNRRLSLERAAAVRAFLAALGVDGQRLAVVGKGSSELLNTQDPLAAENRRVRVVTLE